MNEPLERLQWVRKQTGLNAKEFAESMGMTAPGFHNMVARSSRVTRVLANSVELVHGYRAEWILTGEGLRKTERRKYRFNIKIIDVQTTIWGVDAKSKEEAFLKYKDGNAKELATIANFFVPSISSSDETDWRLYHRKVMNHLKKAYKPQPKEKK